MEIQQIFGFVILIILTTTVVFSTINNANTSSLSASDKVVWGTVLTIIVLGVLVTAARIFGLLEYLTRQHRRLHKRKVE